jgi:hypothetical protein
VGGLRLPDSVGRSGQGDPALGRLLPHPEHVPHTVQAGPEDTHALHISTPAGFAELIARAGTPAHLAPDSEFDADLFMAVTTELGDLVLGPPGTKPADLGRHDRT